MADEVVYRLIAGEGVQLLENSATRTVEVSVPSLSQKLNVGDIGQASQVTSGIIEIANDAEMAGLTDQSRAVSPGGLGGIVQSGPSDATAGKLLRVGAFGIGSAAAPIYSNWASIPQTCGWANVDIGAANRPAGLPQGWYTLMAMSYSNSVYLAHMIGSSNVYMLPRSSAGVFGSPITMWTNSNFDPNTKANTSGSYPGLDVGNAATVGGQLATDLAPPGMRGEFFTPTPPPGWLKANGAAVSRTTYARLFNAIGTFWGAGNGSTTFNLPDARGLFSRAWDDGRGIDAGRAFGSYQDSQNRFHAHVAGADVQGAHQHGLYSNDNSGASGTNEADFNGTGDAGVYQGTTATAGAHSHNITIGGDGGSESRPQNVAALVCIKY